MPLYCRADVEYQGLRWWGIRTYLQTQNAKNEKSARSLFFHARGRKKRVLYCALIRNTSPSFQPLFIDTISICCCIQQCFRVCFQCPVFCFVIRYQEFMRERSTQGTLQMTSSVNVRISRNQKTGMIISRVAF